MKRINNLYNKINNIDIIMDMYDRIVSKNTKNKRKVEKFNDYYSSNIINIKNIINNKVYNAGKYNIFLIKEPKVRLIMSQNISDKVINHLVSKYFLVDILEKSFIDENIATRIGKGTNCGLKLLKKYLNKIKLDGRDYYYLKFDIKKYFYNIDHDIVKKLISNKIKDKDVLNIVYKIIDSTDYDYINENINRLKDKEIERIKKLNLKEKEKNLKIKEIEGIPLYRQGKGFLIGNMSSQIMAILYLNELDHFIKEKLKIKYYIRYMDDGILIHSDKSYLKYCLVEIEKIINDYKLEINSKKTKINSINNGINFLGFNFLIINNKVILKLNNKTKNRFNKSMKKDYNNKKIASYKGHLKLGNCGSLYYKYTKNKLN